MKEGEVTVAFRPTLKIIKNKVAPPYTSAQYDICVGTSQRPVYGIDEIASLIDVGVGLKIITRNSSSYGFNGQHIGNGLAKASAALRSNDKWCNEIREKIYGNLMEKAVITPLSEEVEDEAEDEIEEGVEESANLSDDILDQVTDVD